MSKRTRKQMQAEPSAPTEPQHRIRLPGFVSDQEMGLGDVIKHATSALGIKPCSKCSQRAAQLNRWVAFTGRRGQ